jgi:hypothetical protein
MLQQQDWALGESLGEVEELGELEGNRGRRDAMIIIIIEWLSRPLSELLMLSGKFDVNSGVRRPTE